MSFLSFLQFVSKISTSTSKVSVISLNLNSSGFELFLSEKAAIKALGLKYPDSKLIFSFSSKDCDDKPSIIGFPSFSTSRIVIDNSSESRSWAIDGDDSATVHIYWDMEVVTTFKAYKDTLIINVSYGNIPVTREKAIKIDSFDFSPSCSD